MRIGTLNLFRQGVDAILNRQTDVFRTQQQLGTGKRINSPSDDPAGAAQLISLSDSLNVTRQFQRNIDSVRTRLEQEDTALSSVVNNLQRARELTIQGLNDTNSPQDRRAIAQEIRQITNQVLALANRTDGRGEYLFGGFQRQTAPFSSNGAGTFSYAGDQGQRLLQIGAARQISDGDSGFNVFMKISAVGGGYQDVFTTLNTLATDLEANTPNTNSLTQIDSALQNMLDVQASAGARLNAVDSQQAINVVLITQLEKTRSTIEDLDYAEAASRLNLQSVALQAAQQSFVKVQNLSLFNFL